MENQTKIYVNDKEAKLFLRFLQYQTKWERFFNDNNITSVHIHKNTKGELVVWEWSEKEIIQSVDNHLTS